MSGDETRKPGDSPPAVKPDKLAERRARQAKALRRNLARRKSQALERADPPEDEPGG